MKRFAKTLIAAGALVFAAGATFAASGAPAHAGPHSSMVIGVGPHYAGPYGHRHCVRIRDRVPVYRTVPTRWGGWHRVFIGYRTVWRTRCHYRHYRPWRRGGIRIRF